MTNWPNSGSNNGGGWTPPAGPGQPAVPPSVPQQPGPSGPLNAYGQPITPPAAAPGYSPSTGTGSWTPPPATPQPSPSGPVNAYGQQIGQQPAPASAPYGYNQPPAGYPYGQQPPTGSKNRTPLFIGGGIAVLVVIALVAGWMILGGGSGPDSATSAGDAVKGYLDALARGDANGALAYSDDQPASKDLLSDGILKQQIAKWPITNIRILSDDSKNSPDSNIGFGQVHVSANFGDKTSDVTIAVKKNAGKWRLDHAAVKLTSDLGGMSNQAAKTLTIFGKALNDGTAYVFPGFLDFGTSNQYLKVDAKPVLLDQLALGSTGSPLQATWSINDAANKEIMDQVKVLTASCSASNLEHPPAPCDAQAFGMADGTLNWGPADVSGVKVQNFDQYQGLTVDISGQAVYQVTGTDMFNGGPHAPEQVTMFVNGTADLSKSPLTVSFR